MPPAVFCCANAAKCSSCQIESVGPHSWDGYALPGSTLPLAGRSKPSARQKTVLVLYGDPLSTPADRMTEQGLTAALSSAREWDLEVFSECLDLMRFPTVRYGNDIARYLHARCGTRKPDVLIVLANTTLQFVLDHREELFPGVPIVFEGVDHREVEGREMPSKVTGSPLVRRSWDRRDPPSAVGDVRMPPYPAGGSPQDFAALISEQLRRWAPIVKATGFQME